MSSNTESELSRLLQEEQALVQKQHEITNQVHLLQIEEVALKRKIEAAVEDLRIRQSQSSSSQTTESPQSRNERQPFHT